MPAAKSMDHGVIDRDDCFRTHHEPTDVLLGGYPTVLTLQGRLLGCDHHCFPRSREVCDNLIRISYQNGSTDDFIAVLISLSLSLSLSCIRMFSRNNKLDYQLFFQTRGGEQTSDHSDGKG